MMDHLLCKFSLWRFLKFLYILLFLFCRIAHADLNLTSIPFDDGYNVLFGDDNGNVVRSPDGRRAQLLLDRFTGAGIVSSDMYHHGFFSAKIKLPGEYTAGIVVAFYTSNIDIYEKTHDELDFEFLGNIPGKPWRFQTNLYGNGSVHRGREERYRLWYDPSQEYHRYSILWTTNTIIFYIDDVPIREVKRSEAMGIQYPSKPMSIYATIWDGSTWATGGGKYKLNYKYAPFVADFKEFVLEGCPVDPTQQSPAEICYDKDIELESQEYAILTSRQRELMRKFRRQFMYYSYCYDTVRYPVPPPECVIDRLEKERFKDTGRLKFGGSHRRARRQARNRGADQVSDQEDEMD